LHDDKQTDTLIAILRSLSGVVIKYMYSLKLHKSQTGGKGIVKTCTVMRKGKELNKDIRSKNLHHFVQKLLVPSVRQQITYSSTSTRPR